MLENHGWSKQSVHSCSRIQSLEDQCLVTSELMAYNLPDCLTVLLMYDCNGFNLAYFEAILQEYIGRTSIQ